jgi:tetratricopeptide (TPR) repeat protein
MPNKKISKAQGPELPFAVQPQAGRQAAVPPPTLDELESIFAQALAFHRAGMLAEAERLYRRVLEHRPGSFDCQHLLGVISYQRGNCLEAVRQIDAALKINSRVADAHLNRGNALLRLKRFDESLASYDKAIALKGERDPALLNCRGSVLRNLGRLDEALADLDQAIALRPDLVEAFNNRANVLKDLERLDAALADYDRAIALRPDNADAFNNRGNLHKLLAHDERALLDYEKAIALRPDYAEAFYNHGTMLYDLERFDAALAQLSRAIALKPDYAEAFYNRGTALMALRRIDDALADFAKALALKPDHAEAAWNRGLCNLLAGRWREGWPDYERRWETDQAPPHWQVSGRPLWTGRQDIRGKTLLLHSEQGYGDTIMALRFVRPVAEMGAQVVLEAPPALQPLLTQFEGVRPRQPGEPLEEFDLYCPLMSLPQALDLTLEKLAAADVPYLRAPTAHVERWRRRLPDSGGLKVAINWAGNATFRHDDSRSIGLARMLPLVARSDVQFFGLQKDLREGDADMLRGHPEINALGQDIESFADTAAIISLMDLVISSDTSVVHLAGALGKPVWILLPFVPDWRWLLDRDDSPWYPTARLFRQMEIGGWNAVVDRVAAELGVAAVKFGDSGAPPARAR